MDLNLNFFSQPILQEIKNLGIRKLTKIQEEAIPYVLAGENVLIVAPTGEGKTEAAILPIFEMFLRLKNEKKYVSGIFILYITPLRSLNRDIFRRLVEMGGRLGIKVEVRHGDTPTKLRKIQAEAPPDMLITTPETLQAILVGKRMVKHLKNVCWVIVDEIHELADDKRGTQLMVGLERLQKIVGKDFQRIGLSATVGDLKTIGGFLVGKDRKIKVVRVETFKEMDVKVESPSTTVEDEKLSEKFMVPVGTISRIRRILELVKKYRSTLIFTNTREHTESLALKIRMLNPELPFSAHHGSISRDSRIKVEDLVKAGKLKAVVCTSSLELGIDIGYIDYVIQYQSPKQVSKIIQRIGRSSHIVEGKPSGCILATWSDDILESAVILRKALTGELEKPSIHYNALDVLAHQIVGLTLTHKLLEMGEIYKIVTRAYPYINLDFEDFFETLNQLKAEGIIRFYNGKVGVKPPQSHKYYFENLSMIVEVKHYVVIDFLTKRRVGFLDQEFVARHGKPGNQFILHGSTWQILAVDEDKTLVEVEEVEPNPSAIPSWEGEVIPVPFEIALEVGKLRRKICEKIVVEENPYPVFEGYPLDENSKQKVVETIRKHVKEGFLLPHDEQIVVESFENYTIIHGCFGDKPNKTLSLAVASLLTSKTGLEIAVQSDPYRFVLISPYPIDPYMVKDILTSLTSTELEKILDVTLDQTNLFLWRFWNNAKRFGVVSKDTEYKIVQAKSLLKALKETPIYKETFREVLLEDLDLEISKKIIQKIGDKKIKVEVSPLKRNPSPLAIPLLDKIVPHDLLRPVKETEEIIQLLKERLNSKTVRLVCLFKGDWETLRKIVNLPERIRCPYCGSTLVAVTYENDKETGKIIKKKLAKRKLTPDEEKIWFTAWKSASLIQTYGKKAALVMAGKGIGPTKAAKILGKTKKEEELYMEILKAEREYLRTRMFWDVNT